MAHLLDIIWEQNPRGYCVHDIVIFDLHLCCRGANCQQTNLAEGALPSENIAMLYGGHNTVVSGNNCWQSM